MSTSVDVTELNCKCIQLNTGRLTTRACVSSDSVLIPCLSPTPRPGPLSPGPVQELPTGLPPPVSLSCSHSPSRAREGISHLTVPPPCLKSLPSLPLLQGEIAHPRWHIRHWYLTAGPLQHPLLPLPCQGPAWQEKLFQYQGCCCIVPLSLNFHFFHIFRLRSIHPKGQNCLPHLHAHISWTRLTQPKSQF